MGRAPWKHVLVATIFLLSFLKTQGQNTDCVTAQVICSDGPIVFRPNGGGIDDFADTTKNNPGCLKGNFSGLNVENQSAWYYFSFNDSMPPNSVIEFTISPGIVPGEITPDYDFAIFGPDVKCDSLGYPRRCSFAYELCDLCPETGLGKGAMDESEPARESDGFVAPMVVQPGEGFYLMLDNFNFNGTRTVFTLTWGGSAAPYLNCLANPTCRNKTVDAGDDMQFCQNPAPFKLNATAKNVSNQVKYEWLGTPQALSFLNSKTVVQPTVTIPAGFSGSLDYILSIKDGDCIIADAITVNIIPVAPAQLRADTVICQGETTTISLSSVYQSYRWSTGVVNPTITVNTGGTYSVTVSNGGNCSSTGSIVINQRELPKPIIEGGGKLCSGESLTLRTDTDYRSYFWSNGRTTDSILVDRGGNYSVTVTDIDGCRGTGSFAVTEFSNPIPEITGATSFCQGKSTTLATTLPYPDYSWSSGENSPTITKNTAGLFTVTVTDANGCKGSAGTSITQNDLPSLTIEGDQAFCQNDSTQLSATTNATQITWSNGATTPEISVNVSGSYTVTVSNAEGCQKSDTISITQQPVPQPFITDSITICPENSATLETQSAFASYRWSTGDTTATIKVLQPGSYSVAVTDDLGCTGSATLTVDVFPVTPAPTIAGLRNFCPDNGTTLTTNGNYANYNWSNGDTTASTQIFTSGTYTLIVQDVNGCTSQDSVSVQAFQVTAPASDTIAFCSGTSADLNPGGNYINYNWSNGSTQPNIQVNTPGVYGLTVTDINNCTSSATYTAQENALPQFAIQGEDRFCKGSSIQLSVPPGFQSYQWSNNAATENITIQTAGNYIVTVTDVNNCTNIQAITITELPLPAPIISGVDRLCANEQGILSVNPGFVNYLWSDGTQQATLNITQGGNYVVTVTDSNNCQGSAMAEVASFPNPTVAITADSLFCEGNSASIKATKGLAAYQWSDGSTLDSIVTMTSGVYSLTVTDVNGCKASYSTRITQVSAPIANAGPDQTLDCDTKSVQLGTTPNGQGAYRFQWQGPAINTSNSNTPQPTINQAGTYQLMIVDTLSGCQSQVASVQVADLSYTPQIALQLQDTLDCNTASVTITASNSRAGNGISYQWYNNQHEALQNQQDSTLQTSQPGKYYFEIKDALTGCQAIDSIQVTADFDPAFVEAGNGNTLNCNTSVVTLAGSTSSTAAHILFRWTAPDGNRISNQLTTDVTQPGLYILTITNMKNGCSNRDSVEVALDRTPPVVSAGADQSLDCNEKSASLQGNGSNSDTYYSWTANNTFVFDDPNQLSQTVDQAGLYILEARNLQNGCIAKDSVVVLDNSDYPTKVDLQVIDPTCFGLQDGQIQITGITGGEGPYFFSLNGSPMETVQQFSNLNAGRYQLRVEDLKGCSYETSVTLKDQIELKVELGPDTTIRLGDIIDLEAFVNIPTQNIVNLVWEGEDKFGDCVERCWLQTVAPKVNTPYKVTVTNKQGCQAIDTINVKVLSSRSIYVPTGFTPNGDGYNDVFVIYGGREVVQIKYMRIFNRWGNQVFYDHDFRPNDPTHGWDGNIAGAKEPNSSVFAWIAEIEFKDGKIELFSGDITLIK